MRGTLRDLWSGRVWVAALVAALLGGALNAGLTVGVLRQWEPWLSGFVGEFGPALHLLGGLLSSALVEGSKLALLWLLLRGAVARWLALGIAYGVLVGATDLLVWTLNWLRLPGWITFTPWVLTIPFWPILFHGVLGRLAAGLSHPPGRLWWGWAGATIAAFLLANFSILASQVVPAAAYVTLTEWLDFRPAVLVFAIGVWAITRKKWSSGGPARRIVAAALGAGLLMGFLVFVLQRHAQPIGMADPVTTIMLTLGAGFLAFQFMQRVVLPWVRGDLQQAGQA